MTAIRLRLRVLRNEVPAVLTLWPIADTQLKTTVAQWLHQVNRIFPLEVETWGFEHYVVTLGGYECLHYHELGAVFKDEDEVVIRPLQTAEVRARYLLGRDQVDPSGRHLYDGLPYGRPLLRAVTRPNVNIPARKREVVDVELNGEQQQIMEGLQEQALVRLEEESEEDDSEDDGIFEVEKETVSEESSSDESSSDEEEEEEEDSSDDGSSSSGSSDTSDSSQENKNVSDGSWNGIQSEPPTPPGKKNGSRTESGAHVGSTGSQAPKASQSRPTERSHVAVQQAPDAPKTSLKRKAPSDEPAQEPRETAAKKAKVNDTPNHAALPDQGQNRTKERNMRRRDSKKLAHLKEVGVLGPDADLATLHAWVANEQRRTDAVNETSSQQAADVEDAGAGAASQVKSTSTETRSRASEYVEPTSEAHKNGYGRSAKPKSKQELARLEQQRQQLLSQIASGGVEVTSAKNRKRDASEIEEEDEAPEEMSTKQPVTDSEMTDEQSKGPTVNSESATLAPSSKVSASTSMVPPSVERRSKLDLASSKRLLFGSLGVRVPKTQDEREALQKRLSDRAKQRAAPSNEAAAGLSGTEATAAETVTEAEEEDPEAWREKIDLIAVECCEEGVVLSTPPFPFYQRWDPQQRRKKSKARNGKAYAAQKRRGGKDIAEVGEFVESYDKYNQNGEGDALDYDDAAAGEEQEEYWEEGALLDAGVYDDDDGEVDLVSQQLLDETAAPQKVDDGFPALPDEISSLLLLEEGDAGKGDYIVYQELTCSAATNWQPSMLQRSAQLQEKSDDGSWTLKLAMRDLPAKKVDQEGNRVYSKFEMEGSSDNEDEDESVKTVGWGEMVEVRLLARGERKDEGVEVV